MLHGYAALLKEPYEIALNQGLDQLAPLPVEQLIQLVHATVGGAGLPLDQLIGLLLRCGDLSQNLPNFLWGRWIAVSVAVGHGYVRSSHSNADRPFR